MYDRDGVPVEFTGIGRGSHLRESVFGNEIMTIRRVPWGRQVLSAVTVQAFEDLGYKVDPSGGGPTGCHRSPQGRRIRQTVILRYGARGSELIRVTVGGSAEERPDVEMEGERRRRILRQVIEKITVNGGGLRMADNLSREEQYDRARRRVEAQGAADPDKSAEKYTTEKEVPG